MCTIKQIYDLPLGGTFAVCLFHNRERADSGIFPCLAIVGARAFSDVQVRDGYPYQIRLERCRPGVHRFPGFIKHRIAGVLIRTLLCVLQRLERPFLRLGICPGLPDAVPDFRFCRSGRSCPSCRAEDAFQDC